MPVKDEEEENLKPWAVVMWIVMQCYLGVVRPEEAVGNFLRSFVKISQ